MTGLVAPEVSTMGGAAALPRENGDLVFEAPWQGRMLGLAIGLVDARGLEWDEFRRRLVAAIVADPERPYYDSWVVALESLVLAEGIAGLADVDAHGRSAEG